MKVALVHEFLTQYGGAERVLEALHEVFPSAPVYTLVYDRKIVQDKFGGWEIRPSFLQKLPGVPDKYKWYLSLMPAAIESFDLSEFDLIISDCSAFGKGITVNSSSVHISYIHTPTRYIWQSEDEYISTIRYPWIVRKFAGFFVDHYLKRWDYRAAQRPDILIANSKTVQERVEKYYQRNSEVVYPPVDTDFFHPVVEKRDYFLVASRMEPYKKVNIVIDAFIELGYPLKVAGGGSMLSVYQSKYAGHKNIEFLGNISDEKLRILYSGAKAYIFPALEDAGIMTLESLSCGTPVIGLNRGGTSEFVTEGSNGILFSEQSADSIKDAVLRFENRSFDQESIRESSLPYSKQVFKQKIKSLASCYEDRN